MSADSLTQQAARQALLEAMRELQAMGLNLGATGNASVRLDTQAWLVTPTGVPPNDLRAEQLVSMDMHGGYSGAWQPSSEWRFHLDIYRQRPEVHAVVHTHSPYAAAVACHGHDVPAFHYMIAAFGGDTLRCAPYALFGSQALSQAALLALDQRHACLLANHGVIALGHDLKQALNRAQAVEALCQQYQLTCSMGQPKRLSGAQMAEGSERFGHSGQVPQPAGDNP